MAMLCQGRVYAQSTDMFCLNGDGDSGGGCCKYNDGDVDDDDDDDDDDTSITT